MLLCIVCTHSISYPVSPIIQSILLNVILCSLWQYGCSVSQDRWTPYQYRHANLWLTHTRRMHLHIRRLIQRTYYTSTLTNYNWHQDYILWGDLTHSVARLMFDIRNLKTENEVFSVCTICCRLVSQHEVPQEISPPTFANHPSLTSLSTEVGSGNCNFLVP